MKKRGFTLIEVVIVVAIIAVLLVMASLSTKKTIEDRAVEEARSEVSETIRNYVTRAYNEGEKYTIEIDISAKSLEVSDSGDLQREFIELPQILTYSTSPDGEATIDTDVTVDETIEINIKDGENRTRYTIEVLKKSLSGLIDVNTIKGSE